MGRSSRAHRWWASVGAGAIAFALSLPARAAEEIRVYYGMLGISLKIDALETYAETGETDRQLQFYLSRVPADKRAIFREALTAGYTDASPVHLWNFFNTPMGERAIQDIGRIITLPGGSNGYLGLRSALVLSAASPEGLSLLGVLKQFPVGIRIDAAELLKAARRAERLALTTRIASETMSQLSAAEAAVPPSADYENLPDLREPGDRGVDTEIVTLTDASREREMYVQLHYPEQWRDGSTPVAIISHGLGDRPEAFSGLAEHLASRGYFVAAPQHPGSDYLQQQAMLEGRSGEVFKRDEFIDRPRDVSFVLDTLEARNASDFGGRLDLDRVAVIGHSFGGYTVLALGGATIDFDHLEVACTDLESPNLSLLLQCRALELPRQDYDLRDPRVGVVVAANPVGSQTFGASGYANVAVPTILYAGTYDPAAPAAEEQILVFPQLPERNPNYLGVIQGQAHVDISQVDAGLVEALDAVPDAKLPSQTLVDGYVRATTSAFLEVHLLGNADFEPYLHSAYAQYLSAPTPNNQLFWISNASRAGLTEVIATVAAELGLPAYLEDANQ